MRLSSVNILFLCAGVSMLTIKAANAQILTGFSDERAPVNQPATPADDLQKTEPQVITQPLTGAQTAAGHTDRPVTNTLKKADNAKADREKPDNAPRTTTHTKAAAPRLLTGFAPNQPYGASMAAPYDARAESTQSTTARPGPLSGNPPGNAAPAGDKSPVDLQADTLSNNEQTQTVTARGNVMLVQNGRILRADEISYNMRDDRIIASGNVVLNEENGDIHTAERVELVDEMKTGFVEGLKTYLADGSRFMAAKGNRENAQTTTMESAIYTPCEPCKSDPDKDPVWQIKASEVTHDEKENRISYRNARFELYGVPIAYTPYFSHADGSIKQKSGFLSPTFGLDSELGFSAGTSYYWAIAPDKDATIGVRAFTEQAPLVSAEWRQRWDNASLMANGGLTYSERTDSANGVNFTQDAEWRGHLFANGLWDMNDKWRSGLNIQYASDDQYLRQYDFSSEDVLENEVFAERFSGRHYTAARLISYQDVRIGELQNEDQPQILPEVVSEWIGEPGAIPLIGGRWSLQGSLLGLHREGNGQDMARASLQAGWKRRLISDYGLLTTVDATMRGDFYEVSDRNVSNGLNGGGAPNDSVSETRLFPMLNVEASYPLSRDFEKFQMRIEPVASVTTAPNLDSKNKIPNEDSQDIQLDSANLFEPNRFPGFDRVEDKTRVTYGLRTGLYGYEGSTFNIFAGQSHRFDDDDNPFPAGSGLDSQYSDYVAELYGNYKDRYYFDYRVQLNNNNLTSQRHEFDGTADFGKLEIGGTYLYANSLEGTAINESREQIGADIIYRWNQQWHTRLGAVQDLGANPGLRTAYAGLDHFGQCLNWSISAVRNLTDDASGDSNTELLLRIGLKNLGEFQTSGIELASSSSDADTNNTANRNE